ncbi:hypothetical protein VTN00DRAFT_9673 [Thermoascus crustaceus]|uniref:uncharacterized protein n=1 Tax=Thermoascus crustaceus TaxID=5088 RepID=UPI00374272FF
MDSSIDPITSTVAARGGKNNISPESNSCFPLTSLQENAAPTTASTLIATPRVHQTSQTYQSRNVHIYNDDGIYLGGFFQNPNPHVSNANFYDMYREILTV